MNPDLSKITIVVDDIYAAGICGRGAIKWFRDRGLDWTDFRRNGISAKVLWDVGDGYAQLVVTKRLEREAPTDG